MGSYNVARMKALSPRAKTALRLYVSGAVPSQKAAAEIAGIDRSYLSVLKGVPVGQKFIADLERKIDDGTVEMNSAIRELGRQGLLKIARLMEHSESELIQFKSAQDLADRSPETAKTNKLSVEGDLTLRGGDAQRLIQALVEAAQADKEFAKEVSEGDYVKVDDGSQPKLLGTGEA